MNKVCQTRPFLSRHTCGMWVLQGPGESDRGAYAALLSPLHKQGSRVSTTTQDDQLTLPGQFGKPFIFALKYKNDRLILTVLLLILIKSHQSQKLLNIAIYLPHKISNFEIDCHLGQFTWVRCMLGMVAVEGADIEAICSYVP